MAGDINLIFPFISNNIISSLILNDVATVNLTTIINDQFLAIPFLNLPCIVAKTQYEVAKLIEECRLMDTLTLASAIHCGICVQIIIRKNTVEGVCQVTFKKKIKFLRNVFNFTNCVEERIATFVFSVEKIENEK